MKNKTGYWLLLGAVVVAGIGYFYPLAGKPPAARNPTDEARTGDRGQPPAPAAAQRPPAAAVVAPAPAADTAGQEEQAAVDEAPPPEQDGDADALLPATREAVNALIDTSHTGLEAEPVAGGGEKIHLKKHFRSVPVATRQADGSIRVRDYTSPVPAEDPPEKK